MKNLGLVLACLFLSVGCARIKMEAPKEAIKLDVSMRLDIYQHIANDVDSIEDMVTGSDKKAAVKDEHSLAEFLVSNVYADEGLSPEVQAAALRRKDRRSDLVALEAKGVIGENRSGLVEVRTAQDGADAMVSAENSDRMVIYNAVAVKNGSSLDEVQRIYAKRLQSDAPAGTPLEGDEGWAMKQ